MQRRAPPSDVAAERRSTSKAPFISLSALDRQRDSQGLTPPNLATPGTPSAAPCRAGDLRVTCGAHPDRHRDTPAWPDVDDPVTPLRRVDAVDVSPFFAF